MMLQLFRFCILACSLAVVSCSGPEPTSTSTSTSGTSTSGGTGGAGGAGSSSSGQSSSSGTPDVAEKACAALAGAICDKLDSCAPFRMEVSFGDKATCKERSIPSCRDALTLTEINTNPQKYEKCAAALGSTSCDDFLLGTLPAECRPDPGKLDNGNACGDNAQCKSTLCKKQGECGVCAAKVEAGFACAKDSDCVAGLACSQKTCVIPVAEGGVCGAVQPCLPTLGCKQSGFCGKLSDAGVACQTANECNSLKGVFCNQTSQVCAVIKLEDAGAACGALNGFQVACRAGGECKISSPSTSGTCQAPAADGASCDLANGLGCLEPAQCLSSVCKLPNPAACK